MILRDKSTGRAITKPMAPDAPDCQDYIDNLLDDYGQYPDTDGLTLDEYLAEHGRESV